MNSHPLAWMLDRDKEAADDASPSPPIYSPALCAGFSGNRNGCDACLQTCPHAAITRDSGQIAIDPLACQRCGACVAACPTGALQRRFLGDDELLAAMQNACDDWPLDRPLAIFHCVHGEHLQIRTQSPARPRSMEFAVPSIHLFSEIHLIAAVALGYRGVLLVACPRCESERSLDHPDRMIDLANRLLHGWGIEGSRIRRGPLPADETAEWAEWADSLASLNGPTWPPLSGAFSKRELLIDLTEYFESRHDLQRSASEAKPTDPYAEVDILQTSCTLCGACARTCPTEALTITIDEGLTFRAIDCVACGLCEASCGENAIAVRRQLPAGPQSRRRRLLKQTAWLTCPDCGTTTSGPEYIERLEQRLAGSPFYAVQENRDLLRLCEPCKARRAIGGLPDEFHGAWEPDQKSSPAGSSSNGPSSREPSGPVDHPAGLVSLPVISSLQLGDGRAKSPPPDSSASTDLLRRNFIRWAASIAATAGFIARGESAVAQEEGSEEAFSSGGLPAWSPELIDQNALIRMQVDLARALNKPRAQRRWVMVIDIGRCVGCHACTIACVAENQLPPGVVYRPVIEEETGTYPNVRRRFIPRPCMQCDEPPCVPVCPVDATWKREDGITVIDYNKCIGCRYCLTACPYSARVTDFGEYYSDDTPAQQPYELLANFEYRSRWSRTDHGSPVGNARKCHFCIHRIEEGMLPACVTTCIGVATYFGDANDPESLVSELIASSRAVRLKEEMGTQPKVYYLM